MTAFARCAASSDWSSVRAVSFLAGEDSQTLLRPSRTSAGLLPKNCGEEAIIVPFTMVKCSET